MIKIPCRKCPACGLYHDITAVTCSNCGNGLSTVPAQLIEVSELPEELRGKIDTNLEFYVQKCSGCGTLNFTVDSQKRIRICSNCHKARVASVAPIKFVQEQEKSGDVNETEKEPEREVKKDNNEFDTNSSQAKITIPSAETAEVAIENGEDGDDNKWSSWDQLLGNTKAAAGQQANQRVFRETLKQKDETRAASSIVVTPQVDDDDDDDDEDVMDWSLPNNSQSQQNKNPTDRPRSEITLSVIGYGDRSFTIKADLDSPYLLGRSANQGDLLANDLRVGNEHCYLLFRSNEWFVRDNHSANGTAVNSEDIGYNGERVLRDGDILKLGHHSDSISFRIKIG